MTRSDKWVDRFDYKIKWILYTAKEGGNLPPPYGDDSILYDSMVIFSSYRGDREKTYVSLYNSWNSVLTA